jgi:predicted secreted hydrolase
LRVEDFRQGAISMNADRSTRRDFLLGSAAAGAALLAGPGESGAGLLLPASAAAARQTEPTNVAKTFGNLLRRVKGYPDRETFRLLQRVAASPRTTNQMVEVAYGLLGSYGAIGSELPQSIPPAPALAFPADNGQHCGAQMEWYYLSLSLELDNGALVSVVATFLRTRIGGPVIRGVSPLEQQLYSTSVGITLENLPGRADAQYAVPPSTFYPPTGGVAVSNHPFELTLGKNSIRGGREPFPLRVQLVAEHERSIGLPPIEVSVTCAATNPPFLQGKDGYVGAPGAQSYYYYSWPQQRTTGTVWIAGKRHAARGITWMDHQWGSFPPPRPGSRPLGPGGWSWFEFQFEGNRSLTLSFPHNKLNNGKLPSPSQGFGTYVDGRSSTLLGATMTIPESARYVKSPVTRALYPTQWNIQTAEPSIQVVPKVAVEPSTLSFASRQEYSEAACTAVATLPGGSRVSGVGTCETVGMENPAQYKARAVAFLKAGLRGRA